MRQGKGLIPRPPELQGLIVVDSCAVESFRAWMLRHHECQIVCEIHRNAPTSNGHDPLIEQELLEIRSVFCPRRYIERQLGLQVLDRSVAAQRNYRKEEIRCMDEGI